MKGCLVEVFGEKDIAKLVRDDFRVDIVQKVCATFYHLLRIGYVLRENPGYCGCVEKV